MIPSLLDWGTSLDSISHAPLLTSSLDIIFLDLPSCLIFGFCLSHVSVVEILLVSISACLLLLYYEKLCHI